MKMGQVAVIAAFITAVAWLPAGGAGALELPARQSGANLGDCVAKLEKQGGGWCEIRLPGEHPSISSVWPANLDQKTRMIVGPKAIMGAWSGAAFDEAGKRLYFTGGGHADYGGNEVYEFDLNSGQWARLTDPSPLNFLFKSRGATATRAARYCWVPDMRKVPPATHTYDGLQFSTKTRTIFELNMGPANGSCVTDEEGKLEGDPRVLPESEAGAGLYEFNPSRDEVRNGLAPLSWRRLNWPASLSMRLPRSVEMPNGSMAIGSNTRLYSFDPETGFVGPTVSQIPSQGDGVTVYHPDGMVLSLLNRALLIRRLNAPVEERIAAPAFHDKSLAVGGQGVVYSWDGGQKILSIDPKAREKSWKIYDWQGEGPPDAGGRGVYSKWQYLAADDVFVGIAGHTTGVWVYKHPEGLQGVELSGIDPQSIVDQAMAGASVTIPPGTYGQGIFVGKSLTLNLKDVRLWGVSGNKGIVNVKCDGCSVVVEDFHAEGRAAGCLDGNCAGLKAEGIDFDVTLKRAHIDNTVMGILTDNRGGRLVIEDSLIENTGLDDHTRTLGHSVYAGKIDSLVVRRSTIRNTNGDGHMLKSRAKDTEVENVRLLGGEGFHSRSIDFSCGGRLRVANSVIQHGENTDNPDMIAVGTEPKSCGGEILPGEVSITNSWIIVDRDKSADERARQYGPNFLFRWRAPMASLDLRGNHFVNLDRWSTADTEKGDVALSDYSDENTLCESRAECGVTEELFQVY